MSETGYRVHFPALGRSLRKKEGTNDMVEHHHTGSDSGSSTIGWFLAIVVALLLIVVLFFWRPWGVTNTQPQQPTFPSDIDIRGNIDVNQPQQQSNPAPATP
jgi:hypothetical protein